MWLPAPNVVCGWVVAYKSAGKDRVVRRPVAMKGAMGINPKGCYSPKNLAPMTRMAIANLMRSYLRNVQEYMKKKADAGDDPAKQPPMIWGWSTAFPCWRRRSP